MGWPVIAAVQPSLRRTRRRMFPHHLVVVVGARSHYYYFAFFLAVLFFLDGGGFGNVGGGFGVASAVNFDDDDDMKLTGVHFRVTAVIEPGFLNVHEDPDSYGSPDGRTYSGYLIDMLVAMASESRGNFTYDIVTASGYGSYCTPRLYLNNSDHVSSEAYSSKYYSQYNCATSDVNEKYVRGVNSTFSDIYLGMFYIAPFRQKRNHFTIPFVPPYSGTPGMCGIATGVTSIPDLVKQQKEGKQKPACVHGGGATASFVQSSYPEVKLVNQTGGNTPLYDDFLSGLCEIYITDHPLCSQFVLQQSLKGQCTVHGKPLGVIGEPMNFGLSHYAVGVGSHVPKSTVDKLSYWMNMLMICNPLEEGGNGKEGGCPEGNIASFFDGQGGTGKECGYVLYPETGGTALSVGAIVGIVVGAVAVVALGFTLWHWYRLKQQEHRYKRRFVQQIARNIEIGPSPGSIPPEKLAEQVLHIGGQKGVIRKDDLANWLHDIKMEFISARDFDALWHAIDMENKGEVDPVDFIVFLSACGPEFEQVYKEQRNMSKTERLKLAARRLENIAQHGEEGVLELEHKLEKSCRSGPLRPSIQQSNSNRASRESSASARSSNTMKRSWLSHVSNSFGT